MNVRKALLALALCVPMLHTACSSTAPAAATPAPPNSQQSTVALTNKAIADANLAAIKTVISLRDSGKLSQANTAIIQNWLAVVAVTTKGIGGILQTPQSWPQQRAQILVLLATTTAPSIATTIDPQAQAVVTQIVTLLNQMKVQVTN